MKNDIHPEYGPVLFRDINTGDQWIGASTKLDGRKETFEGQELPVIALDISSFSHPFITGKGNFIDAEGRIDRFKKRFASPVLGKKAAKAERAEARAKAEALAPKPEENVQVETVAADEIKNEAPSVPAED